MSLEDTDYSKRRDYYSRVAPKYEKCILEKTGYISHVRVPQRVLELLSETHERSAPLKVLDLGCGTGLSSLAFFDGNFEVTGLDYSPGMIEECKKRPFKKLVCQSINEDLSVPDNNFDLAICLGAFEFVEDPNALFERVQVKLKDNGIFAFTIPTSEGPCTRLNIKCYNFEAIEECFSNTAFELIDKETFFGWETGHLQALDGGEEGAHEGVDYTAIYLRKNNSKQC